MEQLIHAFGIDAKLIVIQIINFVILLAALSYFLYKPIFKVLRERKEKVEQGLKDAEAAAVARAEAGTEKQAVIAAAHSEADAVSKRAKEHAEAVSATLLKEAEDKASAVIKNAEVRGREVAAQLQKESEAEIAKIAVLAAEKLLAEKLS